MARSPFWAPATAPQKAQNRSIHSSLLGFGLNPGGKFDGDRASCFEVNFQHSGARTELQFRSATTSARGTRRFVWACRVRAPASPRSRRLFVPRTPSHNFRRTPHPLPTHPFLFPHFV